MASLKKRGNYWSIVFKKRIDGKPIRKTYALGTKYKKVAEHKQTEYEKLYQGGKIDPFDPNWNLKEYEKSQEAIDKSVSSNSYYLEELKKDFLNYKSHLASDSLKAYKSVIKLFIEDVGRSMTVNLIEPSDIRSFCLNNEHSVATKRNYLRHLKTFFNWMVEKEIIEENPCNDVHPPKKQDNIAKKIISEEELKTIFKKFREHQHKHKEAGYINDYSQMQFWFKPIITTAFYTGMRRKELIQLRWEQVHLEDREIHVTNSAQNKTNNSTKTGVERSVILFDPAYNRLKAWKKFLGDPNKGLVFPSPRSTERIEIQLTGDTVSKTFKSFVKKSDLQNTIHFHGLRHSCATFMLRKGFDVLEVKEMLGHKSIEVTNRYVHLISNDRKNKARKLGLITTD